MGTESHKDSGCGIFHFYLLLTQGPDASPFQSLGPSSSSLVPLPSSKHLELKPCKHKLNTSITISITCLQLLCHPNGQPQTPFSPNSLSLSLSPSPKTSFSFINCFGPEPLSYNPLPFVVAWQGSSITFDTNEPNFSYSQSVTSLFLGG